MTSADSLETDILEDRRTGKVLCIIVQQPPGPEPLRLLFTATHVSAGLKFLHSRGSYLKSSLKQLDLDRNRPVAPAGAQGMPEKDRDM